MPICQPDRRRHLPPAIRNALEGLLWHASLAKVEPSVVLRAQSIHFDTAGHRQSVGTPRRVALRRNLSAAGPAESCISGRSSAGRSRETILTWRAWWAASAFGIRDRFSLVTRTSRGSVTGSPLGMRSPLASFVEREILGP